MSLSKLLKAYRASTTPSEIAVIPIHHAVVDSNDALSVEHLSSIREEISATEQRCQQMLRDTEAECQTMISRAEQQVQRIEESARASGFEMGYLEGKEQAEREGHEQWEQRIQELEQYMRMADTARSQMLMQSEQVLVRITMEAVSQLLHRELSSEPPDVEGIVSELLQYVTDSMKVEVRVSPEDFLFATEAHPRWKTAKFGEWEITVIPDTRVHRGGCEIRSDSGRIDATIETKLEMLEGTLNDVMQRSVRDDVRSEPQIG